MTMIDDRGRVARHFNIVDIAIAIILLLLVPAAYGSYLLFRSPPPKLLAIAPNRLFEGNQIKVEIAGRDLRPFMRVSFNNVQGRSFLISSTSSALVDLPDLAPGVYDVVLYDYRQEVDRLQAALTIMPQPAQQVVDVEIEGAFVAVPEQWRRDIKRGLKFPPQGDAAEVIAVGTPFPGSLQLRFGESVLRVPTPDDVQVPATMRLKCSVQSAAGGAPTCAALAATPSASVAPDAALTFAGPHGLIRFQVRAVHALTAATIAEATVRFSGSRELLDHLKPGDEDASAFGPAVSRHATLASIGPRRSTAAGETIDVKVRVPVDRTAGEWSYKERPVKAGSALRFETPRYVVEGEIIALSPLVEEKR